LAVSAACYTALGGSAAALDVIIFAGRFNWPIWATQQQGYFANNGVVVCLTLTPGSEYQLKSLIEGKFDLAMTAIDNVIARDEGQGEASVSVAPSLRISWVVGHPLLSTFDSLTWWNSVLVLAR
jgi:ABC-type nitrate/sulfonate/bicarbonate transport system substrate-binding protein